VRWLGAGRRRKPLMQLTALAEKNGQYSTPVRRQVKLLESLRELCRNQCCFVALSGANCYGRRAVSY
jgi:hypothetical protein